MVVNNSVLGVDNNGELGGPAGGITLQGGELLTTGAAFTTSRAVVVNTASGLDIVAASTGTTATYSGVISGGGGLVVGDPGDTGTVVLTGANTYTGGTAVSAATLSVAVDGNLGNSSGGLTLNGGELLATGNLFNTSRGVTVNNGIFAATPSGFAEISGNITVSSGLTIGDAVNNGVVAFSGTNTYVGTTTIVSGATLRADTETGFSPNSAFTIDGTLDLRGSASQVGSLSGTGTVTNLSGTGAVLTAGKDNTSTTFSGIIQNGDFPLALNKVGTGTLILTGNNTYTGGTTISDGSLQVGSGGAAGGITGNVTNKGQLIFSRSDVVTYTGNVSGTGSLMQSGSGTLILTGANVYNGGTTILGGGTLQLGNGGSTGSITGDVLDNGALAFDRSTGSTFGGVIQGVGSITVMDDLLTLTADNTYTGGTTINTGTILRLGNNTTTGSIVGDVVDKGAFTIFRSNDLTLSG